MENVQRLKSEKEELQVNIVSLEELDSRDKLYIHRIENELAEKVQLISSQELTIAQYKQEMTRKTQDLRELHTMIIDQSRPESDPFDDHHFTTGFGKLATDIQSVVKRHFQTTRSSTRWTYFEHVREADDRDFFLQTYVATQLARGFFSRDARVFDLDPKSEEDLADFEDLLHQSQGKAKTAPLCTPTQLTNTSTQSRQQRLPNRGPRPSKSAKCCQRIITATVSSESSKTSPDASCTAKTMETPKTASARCASSPFTWRFR